MASEAEKCVKEVADNLNIAGISEIVLGHLEDGELTNEEIKQQQGVAQQAINAARSCAGYDVGVDLAIEEHLLLDEKSGIGALITRPKLGISATPKASKGIKI